MASVPVYCLCRLPYDVTRFMIECDGCQDWFHGSCVGVEEEAAADIDLYHCPKCEVLHGPSVSECLWGPYGDPSGEDEASLDEQDSLGACFKDAEYIYPSLESDEDDPALKSLPKKKKVTDDAPWSPKARVTPSLPRQSRPVREGTRVASVETGLAAAAAKLAQQGGQLGGVNGSYGAVGIPREVLGVFGSLNVCVLGCPLTSPPQRSTGSCSAGRAQPSPEVEPPPEPPYPPSLADHEYTARPGGGGPGLGAPQAGRAPTPMAPGVFLTQRRPPHAPPAAAQGKRPKKGLATAKQRLGRILKIHRNGKLLL
uniref:Uncharacterized protein n=1 Tax=Melopsittacus undulatus TaxID=13146 RepID=A0A8V5GS44_MELUD